MTESNIMMKLGRYTFSLKTAAYQDLKRSTAYRWQQQDRINRRPAQQYLGIGEETISLSGTVYPYFKGGTKQINAIRAEAETGKPLLLIDGTGMVWGKMVIKKINETQKILFSDGTPRQIDFSLELAYYGNDT